MVRIWVGRVVTVKISSKFSFGYTTLQPLYSENLLQPFRGNYHK